MVIRNFIQCTTCGYLYTLRIGVGDAPEQNHIFNCIKCKEEIHVSLKLDAENNTTKLICVENCIPTEEEGLIYNLHSNYIIPIDKLHEDHAFPWLHDTGQVVKALTKFTSIDNLAVPIDEYMELNKNFLSISEKWKILKRAWSLSNNGNKELVLELLSKHEEVNSKNINQFIFDFFRELMHPYGDNLFKDIFERIQLVFNLNPTEFLSLKEYYFNNLKEEHYKKYLDIFSEFFKDFSEYNQLLIYLKYQIPIKARMATSKAFKLTKMFYGNAYEVLVSHITILACVNNIYNGRRFDQFETMDLKEYFSKSKGIRIRMLNNIDFLGGIISCLDNKIRNASHHQSMKLEGNKIIYKDDDFSREYKVISYAEYLYKCNQLAFSLAILLMIELVLSISE